MIRYPVTIATERQHWQSFAAMLERQRDAEKDPRRRELLARLLGSVRAIGRLSRPD